MSVLYYRYYNTVPLNVFLGAEHNFFDFLLTWFVFSFLGFLFCFVRGSQLLVSLQAQHWHLRSGSTTQAESPAHNRGESLKLAE